MKRLVLVVILCAAFSAAAAPKHKTVTLDVKDADIREILKSMQKQCAIKNLLIDKEVQGAGTFYFTEVPCERAFRVVTTTMKLAMQVEPNSVVVVGTRQH